ncbi:MAG: hypothetical protein Q9166_000012 [cf. Caloplaca sp. 2 TL-2023]
MGRKVVRLKLKAATVPQEALILAVIRARSGGVACYGALQDINGSSDTYASLNGAVAHSSTHK